MSLPIARYMMVPCLVAMVAAAPAVERNTIQDQAISLNSDSTALDRAKRSGEEVAFTNQQQPFSSSGVVPASAMMAIKKSSSSSPSSSAGFQFPSLIPGAVPESVKLVGAYPYFPRVRTDDLSNLDQAGFLFASKQMPIPLKDLQEETAAELQAAAAIPELERGGPKKEKEGEEEEKVEKQKEVAEPKTPTDAEVNEEGQKNSVTEAVKGQEEPNPIPKAEEPEEVEQVPEPSEEEHEHQMETSSSPPPPAVVEPEVQIPQVSRLPEDSRSADAEEALHAKDQAVDRSEIELFLEQLQDPKQLGNTGNSNDIQDPKEEEKEEEEEKEKEEEELMAVANEKPGEAEKDLASEQYTNRLLKYLLLNGEKYGRIPIRKGSYQYPGSYFLRRRRRSLTHRRRLPHIHRRRRSGSRHVARAKRTKRDLYDDDLYYNPDQQYAALQRAEAEEEKEAEMAEFISYLMALYPALYENQPPPQGSLYPGYMWYGANNYPAEAYPEYPEWEEEDYDDGPYDDYELPSEPVPAWEPAFYPEDLIEEEGEDYYPGPAKRQMVDMFPSQRLKRYFFPYAQEPYTHWGAFVPSQRKRNYGDAYRNLKELAVALGNPREPSVYFDAFSDYKKK